LDLERIRAARRVIDPMFLDTPMFACDALGRRLGCTVSIKLETANPVRSFKARGSELVADALTRQGRTAAVCARPEGDERINGDHRWFAVQAHLFERAGNIAAAPTAHHEAASRTSGPLQAEVPHRARRTADPEMTRASTSPLPRARPTYLGPRSARPSHPPSRSAALPDQMTDRCRESSTE
jgi:hypothetical protein